MTTRVFVLCAGTASGLIVASTVFADRLRILGRWPGVVVALALGLLMLVWLIVLMTIEIMRDQNAG